MEKLSVFWSIVVLMIIFFLGLYIVKVIQHRMNIKEINYQHQLATELLNAQIQHSKKLDTIINGIIDHEVKKLNK